MHQVRSGFRGQLFQRAERQCHAAVVAEREPCGQVDVYKRQLMPWIIGRVAERAGLAVGMACNIVPCIGLVLFAILVARMPEEN